jgi:hypothetical protein
MQTACSFHHGSMCAETLSFEIGSTSEGSRPVPGSSSFLERRLHCTSLNHYSAYSLTEEPELQRLFFS